MPAPGLPEYLDPVIGFVQWHIARGMSIADASDLARANPDFAHVSPSEFIAADRQAYANFSASRSVWELAPDEPIRPVGFPGAQAGESMGLRVVVGVEFPDGHIEIASVMVDVITNLSKQDIETAVRHWIDNGGMSARSMARGGRPYPVHFFGVTDYIVVQGGVDNPALTV